MYVNQGEKKKKVKETSAKYEGIVRWIREQIEAEELQPGERIESEYQLCDRFGVSRQTVRHAIAVLEKEGMIEKRRGSGTYIKESGIIGVRRKKTMQIAVMTTFVQEYIFSGIIQEIENKMSRAGYGIQISITNNSVDKERFILKSILDKKRVDGIIAEPTKSGLPNPNLDLYRQIMEQGIPVIFINSYYPELKAPHVSLDDKIAGKMATKYLIQCGHREIAAIFKADDGQGHRRYVVVQAILPFGLVLHQFHHIEILNERIDLFRRPARGIKAAYDSPDGCTSYVVDVDTRILDDLDSPQVRKTLGTAAGQDEPDFRAFPVCRSICRIPGRCLNTRQQSYQ